MYTRKLELGLLFCLGIVLQINGETRKSNKFVVQPQRFQPTPALVSPNQMAQRTQLPLQQQMMADQSRANFISDLPLNSGPPAPNFFNSPNARSPFSNPNLQISQLTPAAIVPQQLPILQPTQRQIYPYGIGGNNYGMMNDITPSLGMMGQYSYGGGTASNGGFGTMNPGMMGPGQGIGGQFGVCNPYIGMGVPGGTSPGFTSAGVNPYGGMMGPSYCPGQVGGMGNPYGGVGGTSLGWPYTGGSNYNQPGSCGCLTDYFPVCGNDGKDYQNLCSLDCVAKNKPGLAVSYNGKCSTNAAGDVGWNTYAATTYLPVDSCAWRCYGGEKPVSDLNGNLYRNECEYWSAYCRSMKSGTPLPTLASAFLTRVATTGTPTGTPASGTPTSFPDRSGIVLRSLDGEDPYRSPVHELDSSSSNKDKLF